MSFRFTNNLTAVLKYRILMRRALSNVAAAHYVGRCGPLSVTYDAYCRVKSIDVADEAAFSNGGGEIDCDQLALAVKAAAWEAQQKVVAAKQEAYRGVMAQCQELAKYEGFSRWFDQDGATLPPYPSNAIRETAAPDWLSDLRTMPGLASAHAAMLPAVMALETPSGFKSGDAAHADSADAQAVHDQRVEMQQDEMYFWERVDLIRRSQRNARGAMPKRAYKDQQAAGATEESVDLRFASDYRTS